MIILCLLNLQVFGHKLNLPESVQVLHATAAAGHLSSSTIYPACLAPYLFATACSDGFTRFWQCKPNGTSFSWSEWKMAGQDSSSLSVPGKFGKILLWQFDQLEFISFIIVRLEHLVNTSEVSYFK